jgi:hypothetical protein
MTYNLTVEGVPEFFANGMLVHNCTRYLSAELDAPITGTPRAEKQRRGYKDRAVQIAGRIKSWMAT